MKKGNNITIKELAQKLGVSVSTVSKSLNDSFEISAQTKKRVRELAKQFNYVPNYHAKNLKRKKSFLIGVVIPDIRAPFFNRVLRGIEKECSRKGYNIITCFSNDSFEREKGIVEMLSTGMVDGIVMSLTKETQQLNNYDHLKELMDQEIPLVLFDRVSDEIPCEKIVVNDFESTYNATKYLLATGSKSILFISPLHTTSVGTQRYKGFQQAVKERTEARDHVLFVEEYQDFSQRLKDLLRSRHIDAILTSNEFSGISALNTVRSMGIRVPEEISVIGFTNGLLSMNSSPPMSTISQHGKKMGKMVARRMINRLEKKTRKDANTTTVIETTLIRRGTTKTNQSA